MIFVMDADGSKSQANNYWRWMVPLVPNNDIAPIITAEPLPKPEPVPEPQPRTEPVELKKNLKFNVVSGGLHNGLRQSIYSVCF